MKKTLIVLFLFLGLILVLGACSIGQAAGLTPDQAKVKAEQYINENLVDVGNEVTIEGISEVGGVYKISVKLHDGSKVDSYMTKDGKTFFPQGLVVDKVAAATNTNSATSQPSAEVSTKTDKPSIELFVMSSCPYGTQIEKGLLPVLALLKDKVDFKLRFCDYSMHGQGELNEELVQTCIQKEQADKLQTYLNCYLVAGDGAKCLTDVGVNKAKLNDCVAATDKQYKVTEDYNTKTDWKGSYPPFGVFAAENQKYGVQGSPTLVINGAQISSGRDSQSLLNVICTAFTKAPAECSQQLDANTPDPGFGTSTGNTSSTSAGCATTPTK